MGGREEVLMSRLRSNMQFSNSRLSHFKLRPAQSALKGNRVKTSYKKKSRYV